MAQPRQGPKPPILFTLTRSTEHGQAVIRLASPSGRILVLSEADLKGSLYRLDMLGGRGAQVLLPRATAEALTRLGTVLEPPSTPTREETP